MPRSCRKTEEADTPGLCDLEFYPFVRFVMAVLEEVRLAFGQSSFYILIYAQLSCEFYHLRIGHLLSSDFVTGE